MVTKKPARPGLRRSRPAPALGCWFVAAAAVLSAPAFAAQTDITISMDKAPATPRIQPPTVIGAIPGSPFLFTIPATGQAPLSFAATNLPEGLTIDASTGTISGTTPVAGSYAIDLTVTNGSGSASGTLTLTAGSTLALTPPMGWNSYDSFYENVKESDVKAAADAMRTYLQPYGWNHVVIDYRWYDPEAKNSPDKVIDANGRYLPSPSKYPNANGTNGFKPLAAYVHSKGLGFGIHLMRGVPRVSVDSKRSPIADSTYAAPDAANTGDKCAWDDHMYGVKDTAAGQAWYDSIYKQYASWDVDFVKVDDMMNPYGGNVTHSTEVVQVHNAIVKTGRSMVLSLSPGPFQTKDVAVLNANANMWRTVNDFWDTNGLSTISDEFTASNNWANTNGITPGHWPDADMLPLGTIGNRACAFSKNQQVMVMSLWSIMPSPLMFGGQPTKLSNDAWTLALLTNEEVLAVNQDALGARGKRIAQAGSTEVWAKDMSGGRKAVALFNRGTQDATVSATFSQLGVTGTPLVRDLWNRKDATGMTSGISVNVPHESALMYVIGGGGNPGTGGTTGTGGAGGGPGTGGRGGDADGGAGRSGAGGSASGGRTTGSAGASGGTDAAGAGGRTGRGGSSASGGTTSTGGTVGSGGAAASGGAGGAGGSVASGGSSGGSGGVTSEAAGGASGGSSAHPDNASSGCACALGSRTHSSAWLLLVFAAAILAVRARVRIRPTGRPRRPAARSWRPGSRD